MQQAQQLDAFALEAVHHNERGAADHQLAGALLAPGSTHLRVLQQDLHLLVDAVTLAHGGQRIVLGDVVELGVAVIDRAPQPHQH